MKSRNVENLCKGKTRCDNGDTMAFDWDGPTISNCN